MKIKNIDDIYEKLKQALDSEIKKNNLYGKKISVRCKVLSSEEAIGKPSNNDYPIQKGKEKMVEALFEGARGHAFSDDFENTDYMVEDLVKIPLDSNRKRVEFIASLNAIYRYLKICDKTVHCKDEEPVECAKNIYEHIDLKPNAKVLLVGLQPRFLEFLSKKYEVRVLDLDEDNIGKTKYGIEIEAPEKTHEAIEWSDLVFATGSTIVNATIVDLINCEKPIIFYGVTISAAAKILNLKTYCKCGH